MKKKGFLISVLAVLFFVLSGVSVFAGNGDASSVDLEKAVEACRYRVQLLESKFIALDSIRKGDEPRISFRDRDAEGAYGSAYYGYLLDN